MYNPLGCVCEFFVSRKFSASGAALFRVSIQCSLALFTRCSSVCLSVLNFRSPLLAGGWFFTSLSCRPGSSRKSKHFVGSPNCQDASRLSPVRLWFCLFVMDFTIYFFSSHGPVVLCFTESTHFCKVYECFTDVVVTDRKSFRILGRSDD